MKRHLPILYCSVMRIIWWIGFTIYNFAEDRRPSGGFHPENLRRS